MHYVIQRQPKQQLTVSKYEPIKSYFSVMPHVPYYLCVMWSEYLLSTVFTVNVSALHGGF